MPTGRGISGANAVRYTRTLHATPATRLGAVMVNVMMAVRGRDHAGTYPGTAPPVKFTDRTTLEANQWPASP